LRNPEIVQTRESLIRILTVDCDRRQFDNVNSIAAN